MLVFADEAAQQCSNYSQLTLLHAKSVSLLVEPEGGLSEEEREALRRHEASVVLSLGPIMMRADTAASAGLSLM
jgi:16S rRNA (uracil1498-N3)-methyltransferase